MLYCSLELLRLELEFVSPFVFGPVVFFCDWQCRSVSASCATWPSNNDLQQTTIIALRRFMASSCSGGLKTVPRADYVGVRLLHTFQ